jgi:hypothetical protein
VTEGPSIASASRSFAPFSLTTHSPTSLTMAAAPMSLVTHVPS